MRDPADTSVRLVSFKDDQPQELRGSLIPRSVREAEKTSHTKALLVITTKVLAPAVAVLLLALVAVSGYGLFTPREQVAAPAVTIIDPASTKEVTLSYGPQTPFADPVFFSEARDAFIEKEISFIEVDFETKMVRQFIKGVLTVSAPVVSFGQEGSWFDAPSGLYTVDTLTKREFSTLASVYFPFAIQFEGNYAIHGTPEYPDGRMVPDTFAGGGIQVENDTVKQLFDQAVVGMPVIVHKKAAPIERFDYITSVPGVRAPQYLIADVETGTIIAANNQDTIVPIASVTKLMTAIVVAEKIDLNSRIQVTSPSFIQSLVPRLKERTSASVYSLLQLLLVESSNEAAEVLAGHYGRSDFIVEMNTKAKQLGMLESTFVDPSGLGNENTSTVTDLLRLTQYIYSNRDFIFEITAKEALMGIRDTGEFTNLENFNEVDTLDNFVGGKIGETTAAGQTSVSLHTVSIQGSKRTIAVILLGSTDRDEDVKTLVGFVEDQYKR